MNQRKNSRNAPLKEIKVYVRITEVVLKNLGIDDFLMHLF